MKRKYTLVSYEGEFERLLIGPEGELIADFSAPCTDDYDVPEDYRANARKVRDFFNQGSVLLEFVETVARGNTDYQELQVMADDLLKDAKKRGKS